MSPAGPDRGYDAFISYSHKNDRHVAGALQAKIQGFGRPWYRRRQVRVFRDDTSLSASPELWPAIEAALLASRYLVLLASPDSARSVWVSREISAWFEHRGEEEGLKKLLIALTAGDVDDDVAKWAARENTPLPPALGTRLRTSPLWVDLRSLRSLDRGALGRNAEFIHASAKLAAPIHGIALEDLLSEEVQQQKRSLRHAKLAGMVILLLACGAGYGGYRAEANRRIAVDRERAALIAQSRYLAQAAGDLLEAGDSASAAAVSLEALPDSESMMPRPYDPDSEAAAYAATAALRERHVCGLGGPLVGGAFSDDGAWIVAAAARSVRAWKTADLSEVFTITPAGAGLDGAALSGNKQRMATLSDGEPIVWDVVARVPVARGQQHPHARAISINRDGGRVATASLQSLRLYDAGTGTILQEVRGDTRNHSTMLFYEQLAILSLHRLEFSSAGDRVLALMGDLRPVLMDAKTGRVVAVLLHDHHRASLAAAFSGDGSRVVTEENGALHVWSARTGERLSSLSGETQDGRIWRVAMTRDNAAIVAATAATATRQGAVFLWDAATGDRRASTSPLLVGASVCALAVNSSRLLLGGAVDGRAALLSEAGPVISLVGHTGHIRYAALANDGRTALTGSVDGTLRLWDVAENEPVTVPLAEEPSAIRWSANSGALVITDQAGKSSVWDVEAARFRAGMPELAPLPAGIGRTAAASARSPGRDVILEQGREGLVLRNSLTGSQIAVLSTESNEVESAEFSPTGEYLATAGFGEPARVWRSEDGKLVATLAPSRGVGNRFADTPEAPQGGFTASFDRSGLRVVTTYHDSEATVWDIASGRVVARFANSESDVMVDAVVSPNGLRLATALWRGGVKIWSMFDGTAPHVEWLKRRVPRCLTAQQRASLFLPPEPPRWCITGAGLEREEDASKWAGKWPYQGGQWKTWLQQRDGGIRAPGSF